MKKLKYLLLAILFLPIMVSAKEYCTVVSGNGNEIGSEISCGGENFYIIDNEGSTLKLLAKYNLDAGYQFDEIVVSEERYNELITTYRQCSTYNVNSCWFRDAIMNEEEFSGYQYMDKENEENHSFVVYKPIQTRKLKQKEKAIGAHGNAGHPEYPEYGVVYMNARGDSDGSPYGGNYFQDLDLYEEAFFGNYDGDNWFSLEDYEDYLYDQEIEIEGINLITVKEIDDIVFKASGSHLPLEEWAYNGGTEVDSHFGSYYFVLGNMKEYLPAGYEWLYATTYWTRTNYPQDVNGFYFVDTLGDLCTGSQCQLAVAGIRPVIELDKDNIRFTIKTQTDGNGTIEVVDSAAGGETITFRVSAKKDLKLSGLTIITDGGEKVEFNEEDITQNSDGTISISTNKFTMPYANVTIQARWSVVNPYTSSGLWLILIVLVVTGIGIKAIKKEKTN